MKTISIELPETAFSALRKSPDEFAQESHLVSFISYQNNARTHIIPPYQPSPRQAAQNRSIPCRTNCAAYLLKKNKSAPWQLVFGFSCQGIHSFLSAAEIDGVFDQVEAGLKDFPQSESVTFHLGAFKTDRDRQASLASLIKRAPTDEVKFLLMGERQRVQELAASGLREPKLPQSVVR